jgi:anti-anti-sigma regulatory factor
LSAIATFCHGFAAAHAYSKFCSEDLRSASVKIPFKDRLCPVSDRKLNPGFGKVVALPNVHPKNPRAGGRMRLHMDHIGNMAVVECQGRMVHSGSASRLRDAVISQDAPVIVLDLSEVYSLGGEALAMLIFLQHWTAEHAQQMKIFNPSRFVRHRLEQAKTCEFTITSLNEMMAMLASTEDDFAYFGHAA